MTRPRVLDCIPSSWRFVAARLALRRCALQQAAWGGQRSGQSPSSACRRKVATRSSIVRHGRLTRRLETPDMPSKAKRPFIRSLKETGPADPGGRLDQLVNLARRDADEPGRLHHREQRLLQGPARPQKAGARRSPSQLRRTPAQGVDPGPRRPLATVFPPVLWSVIRLVARATRRHAPSGSGAPPRPWRRFGSGV